MIFRPSPARRNIRRSRARRPSSDNVLQVTVRSRLAAEQRNRKLFSWTIKLTLFALLVGGAIYGTREGVRRYFWENPKYQIAVVEIRSNGQGVTREMVLATSGLEVGRHIYDVSLSKAEKALESLPQVADVKLRRVLPNKITVELTERWPVAWLADPDAADPTASDRSYLVDAGGIVFRPKRQVPEYLRLPVIYGAQPENYLPGEKVTAPEVAAALELITLNHEHRTFEIASIDLSKRYCIVVTNPRNRQYTFALDDLPRQMERCATAVELAARNQVEIQTINLMMRRNVPVTYTRVGNDLPPEPAKPASDAGPVPETVAAETASEPEKAVPRTTPKPAAKKTVRKATTPSRPARSRSTPAKAIPKAEPVIPRAEPVIRKALPVRQAVPVAAALPQ